MIGWLILAAVLVPALVLGRWAERERRRDRAPVRTDLNASPARADRRVHGRGRPAPGSVRARRAVRRGAAGRSRTYAGR